MAVLAVAEIGGSARERGRQHGSKLKDLVQARDRRWRAGIEAFLAIPAERFIARFLADTAFPAAIERWTPDLLEEVRGIAEGADLPFDAVLAAQFMDEEWWYSAALKERLAGGASASQSLHHCSSFAGLRPGGGALLGQNMDLVRWTDGFQTLLLIRELEPGLDAYVLTMAGMIGLCGVNSAGLGLCVNTLADLAVAHDGLPVAFVSRGLLARRSFDDAAAFLTGLRHASGQNYIVSDGRRVGDFECSTDRAVPFVPEGAAAGCVWHTNHALANRDRRIMPATPAGERARLNSASRMAALERRLKGRSAAVDMTVAQDALASRDDPENPVSVTADDADRRRHDYFSFASVIWEVGADIVAHVAPGAPSANAYQSFRLERGGARAVAE